MNSITLKYIFFVLSVLAYISLLDLAEIQFLLNVLGSCMYAFDFYTFNAIIFGLIKPAWLNTFTMVSRYKNENLKKLLLCTSLIVPSQKM